MAWGDRVRPIARAGDAVEPLVIDDFGVEPAEDPVVGPELCAARTRLGLTRRPACGAHPDPAARDRVDRGRRLRALRWRLLCARPPADAGPGARCRRGAAAGDVRREVRRRTDQPTTGVRGRARHRHQRLHPLHRGRHQLVAADRRRDGADPGLVAGQTGHGRPDRAPAAAVAAQRLARGHAQACERDRGAGGGEAVRSQGGRAGRGPGRQRRDRRSPATCRWDRRSGSRCSRRSGSRPPTAAPWKRRSAARTRARWADWACRREPPSPGNSKACPPTSTRGSPIATWASRG